MVANFINNGIVYHSDSLYNNNKISRYCHCLFIVSCLDCWALRPTVSRSENTHTAYAQQTETISRLESLFIFMRSINFIESSPNNEAK